MKFHGFPCTMKFKIAGVPQGTIFGMDGFVIHVNDLKSLLDTFKYVDDTTTMEIVPTAIPNISKMQENVEEIVKWCTDNEMVINTMGMRCFCARAQKQVDKTEIYLAISSCNY